MHVFHSAIARQQHLQPAWKPTPFHVKGIVIRKKDDHRRSRCWAADGVYTKCLHIR